MVRIFFISQVKLLNNRGTTSFLSKNSVVIVMFNRVSVQDELMESHAVNRFYIKMKYTRVRIKAGLNFPRCKRCGQVVLSNERCCQNGEIIRNKVFTST